MRSHLRRESLTRGLLRGRTARDRSNHRAAENKKNGSDIYFVAGFSQIPLGFLGRAGARLSNSEGRASARPCLFEHFGGTWSCTSLEFSGG